MLSETPPERLRRLEERMSAPQRAGALRRVWDAAVPRAWNAARAGQRALARSGQWVATRVPFRALRAQLEAALSVRFPESSRLSRYVLHVVVILLAVAALRVIEVQLPQVDLDLPELAAPVEAAEEPVEEPLPLADGEPSVNLAASSLIQAPVPRTIRPDRQRMEILTYTVQPNDTLSGIAAQFGVSVETIMWSNKEVEDYPDLLSIGQVLQIPPVDGIYYTVQAGETVDGLAKRFTADAEAIKAFPLNGLQEPFALTPGQQIVIPGGRKPYVPKVVYADVGSPPAGAKTGTGRFGWPISGLLTQGYHAAHRAIDVGAPIGTPVYAADSGYVTMAGRTGGGYGTAIVINHGNGFQTLYAHLSAVLVRVGDSVSRGDRIGSCGNTGRSTGPHLHFEIRLNGVQRNPLGYLR
jgi:murein DD-endopeptidase MepM/ murein hydrolase activator NlpD